MAAFFQITSLFILKFPDFLMASKHLNCLLFKPRCPLIVSFLMTASYQPPRGQPAKCTADTNLSTAMFVSVIRTQDPVNISAQSPVMNTFIYSLNCGLMRKNICNCLFTTIMTTRFPAVCSTYHCFVGGFEVLLMPIKYLVQNKAVNKEC